MHSAFPAEQFDRELALAEREWLDRLPQAVGAHPSQQVGRALTVAIVPGQVRLSWRPITVQGGAGGRAPRLRVSFRFQGLDDLERYRFMKRFDLCMQPGERIR